MTTRKTSKAKRGQEVDTRLLLGGAAALIVVLLALLALSSQADSLRYRFVIRGLITEIDAANKTMKVDVTNATGDAFDDLGSKNKEFQLKDAKFYQRVAGKDKRITIGKLAVGQEVGLKGTANDDGKYYITWLRVHDRSFSVVGELNEHTTSTRTLKIYITSSTYKETKYKDTEVTMKYLGDATFKNSSGTAIVFDDVTANNQKVKVTGTVTGTNTWEVSTLQDGYTKKK